MLPAKSLYTTAIIASLVAIGPLATDMYLPTFPALMLAFGSNISQVQYTLSIFLVGFALAQLIYGPLSDRFGRKPMLLAGLLLFTLSSIGITYTESIEALSLMRLLQAIGGSAGPVLGRAMVRDTYGPEDSARLLSYIGTAMALAPAAAPILGGYMTLWFGWESIFLFLALYGLIGCLLLAFRIPETAPLESKHPISPAHLMRNYIALLRNPMWRWYSLTGSFVFAGLFSFLSGSSFVIISFLGYGEEQFGLFFAVVVAGFMIGTLTAGKLVRRLGINYLIGLGSVIAASAGTCMALLAVMEVHHISAIILPQMFYMIGVGIIIPQAMAGAMAPFPHMAGTASALFGFLQMSLAAGFGVLVGHYHDGTPLAMASSIALMGLLTLGGSLMLRREQQRDAPNQIAQPQATGEANS